MTKWTLIAVSACAMAAASVAQARDFTIAGWGGNYQDAQREAYYKPFFDEKGVKFTETTYLGGLAEVKTMADTGDVTWDLVIAESSDLLIGCDEGLFEELDWDSMPGKEQIMEVAQQRCSAGNVVIATGLAYNADTIGDAKPESWADFFDTTKWPGKRGLRTGPKYNLEYALLADGVPLEEIYEVLSTPEGVDRAFAKLDTIKGDLQFWDAGAQPVEWLAANNVVMTASYNARISAAQKEGKNLAFVWKNPVYNIDAWAIPADAPNKDLALEFINFANTATPQAKFSELFFYGPTNLEAASELPADVQAKIPAGDNIKDAFLMDDAFWADNGDALTERWNDWASQ